MSLLGTYSDSLALAATSTVALPKPAPQPRLSLWGLTTAAPKGAAAAGAERAGFASDVLGAFGQVLGAYPEAMGASVSGEQRKQADEARQKLLTEGMDFSSEAGDLFRGVAREYRPDAKTASTAENVVFGLTRGLAKIAGDVVTLGPAGTILSGLDEATMVADDLKQEGVPLGARSAAGAVQGGFMAGGAVLPMAGQTLKATAALYLAGGPAGFVAQQAITRHILENAGQDKAAAQFDPFDPVGLAVASIIPLPFAHYSLKANRAAQAEAFRTGPVPSEPTPLANRIAEAYAPEHVDAARVLQLVEQRRSTNVGDPADLPAMARHEAALARAEEQIAAGERVSVADEAPDPWNAPRALPEPALVADDLRMMGQAAYWAQTGGSILRDPRTAIDPTSPSAHMEGDVVGRTTWIPAQEWFGRMRQYLGRDGLSNQDDIQAAIEKAIQGQPLKAKEQRTVDYIRHELDDMHDQIAKSFWIPPDEAQMLAGESFGAGLSRSDAPDIANVARAAEMDPDAVERAAMQYENDDAGFMSEVQRIIDASRPEQPAQVPSSSIGEGGAIPREAQTGKEAGATAETQAVASRLAEVSAKFPELQVMLDGMDSPQKLADFLASVKAEADEMNADAPLLQVAAECALLNPAFRPGP